MVFNFDVRAIWRRTPLFYVTILATLCIKGLKRSHDARPICWYTYEEDV